jgi:potassium-transporting ATPase KdpC subunit
MRRQWVAALRILVALTVLTGVVYPLVVTGVAQLAMKNRANGSLVKGPDGSVVGSSLIGQAFDGDRWFQGRPDTYDPKATAFSNLGPSNPALNEEATTNADAVRTANHLASDVTLPVDAVTSSASSLDPDVSVAYAKLQAPRVASARGLSVDAVLQLIDRQTEGRTFGILGEPRVNILMLNLALEGLASSP